MLKVNVEKVALGVLSKLEVFNVSQSMTRKGYRYTYPIKGTNDLIVSDRPLEEETADHIYELIERKLINYREEAKMYSIRVAPFRYDSFEIKFG